MMAGNRCTSIFQIGNSINYIPKIKKKQKKKKYERVYIVTQPKAESYNLGELWLGTTNNDLPEQWNTCKIHFTDVDDENKLIMNFDSNTVIVHITNDVQVLKDLLMVKLCDMRFSCVDGTVMAHLFIYDLPLKKFYAKVGTVVKTLFSLLYDISAQHDDVDCVKSSNSIEHFSELYKNIVGYRDHDIPKINVHHAQLKPTLRPYQESAVQWMIFREKDPKIKEITHPLYQEVVLKSGEKVYLDKYTGYIDKVRPSVGALRTGGILADEMGLGKTVELLACILLNPKPVDTNVICEVSTPPVVDKQRKRTLPRSRVTSNNCVVDTAAKRLKIRDDWVMGRSKKSANRVALETWYNNILSGTKDVMYDEHTVKCICGDHEENDDCFECVDCSKVQHGLCLGFKEEYGSYRCPQCWMDQPLLESRATLIVAPMSLQAQWCQEICKHVKTGLKVLQYGGGSNLTMVYPTKLQQYDIVITTYSVLQNELRLSENGQIFTLRRQPKYSQPGSPITRIKWWRLCLDEAQAVESPGNMVSAMTQRIHAHHRWAVTGTPITKDISDLYGLIDYLQLTPYSEQETWNHVLYKPYINNRKEAMYEFLGKVLWRTAKDDVIDQINIPKQVVEEHWLEFTAVEKFFYKREHELSSNEFLAKLPKMDLNIPLKDINKSVLKCLMNPLLALRQACAHHQAVRGRYLATRKQVNSMEDLLDALIGRNINDGEEHLRIVVSALNGLAGIYLLLQNPLQAAEEYRKVLQLSARFTKEPNTVKLTVDKLQLIHSMYNLSEVLQIYPSIPPTTHDDTLKDDCVKLEKEYLNRFIKETMSALEDSMKFEKTILKQREKFILNPGQWFADVVDFISSNDLFDDFERRYYTLNQNAVFKKKYLGERAMLYTLALWDEDISKFREETIEAMNILFERTETLDTMVIPENVVQEAVECHLQQGKKTVSKKCSLCVANVRMKQYECKLFNMDKQTDDVSNKGNWRPAIEECILKALYNFGRAKNVNKDILNDAELHLGILDALKKEFKEIRKFWTYLSQVISAIDEVEMCKIRLKIKQNCDNEKPQLKRAVKDLMSVDNNKLATIHMLEEHEVDYHRALLTVEVKANMASLEKTLGTHKYLQTLRQQQNSGKTPDPCPICKNVLDKHWNILSCGHCFCLECIQVLIGQTTGKHITCCMCRVKQSISDISFFHVGDKVDDSHDIKIKGNYSTKVEAVVRLVMKLRNEDADVKILIFSNWALLLKLLDVVLNTNDVSAVVLSHNNFDKTLDAFKNKPKKITALLLPVNLGSKGLNLIEATHVIFVEPLLNPGDELQAVGRIHRIGQTKPTTVHKFFMRHTIEENIYHATTSNADEWGRNKVTLGHIKQLFEVNTTEVFTET